MNIGTLTASLGLDTRGLDQGLSRAESRMDEFAGSLQRTGKQMQRTGKQMSMYLSLPLAGFGAMALKTAGEFEAGMKKVEAISQATGDDLKGLEELARDLGATTMFSATEAAEGMSYLAMAGFEVNEMMEALPATLDLAAAGQMDLGRSADIVSDTMQGFGLEAEETARVADVMAKTFTTANTTLEMLGQGMSYAAPVANTYGIAIEETAAAIGFLSDAGLKAGRAGRTVMQSLLQLADKADNLGLSIYDAEGNMKSMAGILEEIEDSGLKTTEIIEELGARAGPGMALLLEKGSDALREYTGELEDSAGTASEVADKQMEGLMGALKELRSAFAEVQIAIAESGLLEHATNLTQKITGLLRRIGDINKNTLAWITAIGAVVAAIGPFLMALGTLSILAGKGILALKGIALWFGRLPALITATNVALKKLAAAAIANPILAIAAAVMAVGYALYRWHQANQQVSGSQRALNEVTERATEMVAEERAEVARLIAAAQDETRSHEERKQALRDLNRVSEEHFGHLELTEVNLKKVNQWHQNYTSSIREEKAELKALTSVAERYLYDVDKQADYIDKLSNVSEEYFGHLETGTGFVVNLRDAQEEYISNLKDEKEGVTDLVDTLNDAESSSKEYEQARQDLIDQFPEQEDILKRTILGEEAAKEATEAHTEAIMKQAKVAAAKDMLTELYKERIKVAQQSADEQVSTLDKIGHGFKTLGNVATGNMYNITDTMKDSVEDYRDLADERRQEEIDAIDEEIKAIAGIARTSEQAAGEAESAWEEYKDMMSDADDITGDFQDETDKLVGVMEILDNKLKDARDAMKEATTAQELFQASMRVDKIEKQQEELGKMVDAFIEHKDQIPDDFKFAYDDEGMIDIEKSWQRLMDVIIGTGDAMEKIQSIGADTVKVLPSEQTHPELLEFLDQYQEGMDQLAEKYEILGEIAGDEMDLAEEQLEKTIRMLEKLVEEFMHLKGAEEVVEMLRNEIARLEEELEGAGEDMVDFSRIIARAMTDAVTSFAEGIGKMISGIKETDQLMVGVLETFADILEQLGRMAIASGLARLAITAVLTPAGAIAAGVAAIALAGVVRSRAAGMTEDLEGRGSVPQMAAGGLVHGRSLVEVGEYSGAQSNPEVIAPLSNLKNELRPAGRQGVLQTKIQRDELKVWLDEGDESFDRRFG